MATYSALPATLNLVATVGNDFTLALTVTENGSSWVSTGATLATDIIDSSGTVVATDFTTAASTGTVSLSLTDANTTTLGVGVYSYRLSVTKSSLTRDWIAGTLSIVEAGQGGSSTSSASLAISNSAVTLSLTSLVAPLAENITLADAGGYYTGTDAEAVLAEIGTELLRFPYQLATPRSLLPAPVVMSSAPTVTLSAANAATGIASATSRFLAPSGVLASWWRMLGGGTPSTSTVATLANTVGASTTWLTDATAGTAVKGTVTIEFMTDADDFEFTVACITTNALRYRVWADGQLAAADSSTAAGSGASYHRLRVTFATAVPRLIRLELTQATIYSVRALPAYSLWAPGDPLGPRVALLGDSFAEGSQSGWYHSYGWEMCHRLGWRDYYQSALGGTGYLNPGTGGRVKFRDRVANDIITPAPDWVIVAGGINDTGYSTSAVQTEADLLFAQIKAGLPNCKLIVLSPFQSSDTQLTTIRSYRDVIFAAATPYADLLVDMVDETVGPWITGTGKSGGTTGDGNADINVASDGVHYTRAGYRYVGARLAQEIVSAFT